jgi:endonuclease YncB( thermonuclease family)
MREIRALITLLLLLLPWPLLAEEVQVNDDLTLRLEDGRTARLADIELPRPLLNGKGPAKPAAIPLARKLLIDLTVGKSLSLTPTAEMDRWHRLPIQTEPSLQVELLRRGLARVMPETSDTLLLNRLFTAETEARTNRLGLWADEAFSLRDPNEAGRWLDSLQVFEGSVTSTNLARGFVYLNFGEDWKHGLSVKISRAFRKALPGDPLGLTGRRLRVRGWVGKGMGPMIEIRHIRQLELLDGPWPAKLGTDPAKEIP